MPLWTALVHLRVREVQIEVLSALFGQGVE